MNQFDLKGKIEVINPSKVDLEPNFIQRFLEKITGKTDLAKRAKALNLDAIHDTVHEMARDEARHGKAFAGLLARYFGK